MFLENPTRIPCQSADGASIYYLYYRTVPKTNVRTQDKTSSFEIASAHIFMQSSGQQGSGPEGADSSDSAPAWPLLPPLENVRDLDLWPEKNNC